ncbi:MAG: hypothetical protein IT285_03735 [Bdellovibrionales bacterium]|nr:hypothetical protein [Bdellovibrionales bacterium]
MQTKQRHPVFSKLTHPELEERLRILVSTDEGDEDDFLAVINEYRARNIILEGRDDFEDDCPLCLMLQRQVIREALPARPPRRRSADRKTRKR